MLSKLADVTKNEALKNPTLKNALIQAEIKNGRVNVKPFDLKAGNLVANIGGSQGMDGTLDYVMKMDVPAGQLANAASSLLGNLAGNALSGTQTVTLNFKIGGTSKDPKIVPTGASLNGGGKSSPATQVKEAVKQQVEQKVDEVKKQAEEKARVEAERLKKEAEAKAKKEAEDKLKNAAKEKLKGFGF
jgi:hypothetical protein